MLRSFPIRIIISVCTLLFVLASLIPLTQSWGDNVIEGACSIGSIIRTDGTNRADSNAWM